MSLEIAPNIGFFCGHTWIRKQVLGMDNRDPSNKELVEMKNYVKESMKMGAIGFTTGLLYVPANFAKIEEVVISRGDLESSIPILNIFPPIGGYISEVLV